jgi:tetratricopeptide (TPR) repeat protein
VDTLLADGPIVLAVDAEGPAAQAGVEVGDVVLEADGAPVKQNVELLDRVRSKKVGESLVLKLSKQGSPREVRLEIGQTPLEIPLNQEGFLYNKAMIDLKHRMVIEPANEPLARLNLALCHMQLGNYETALKEEFPRITFEEQARGISQGTVYYYQGLAYMKLEEFSEAVRLFNQALGFEEATLESKDGPRVAPLAARRLREIGQ